MTVIDEHSARSKEFFDSLLMHSFSEIFELLNREDPVDFSNMQLEELEKTSWESIMLTISTSNFRLTVLLHCKAYASLSVTDRQLLINGIENEQRYRDYMCEIGNYLCGAACRMLGAKGFSTGASTPAIIANPRAASNTRQIDADYETHVGGFNQGSPQLCASIFLFAGREFEQDLQYMSSLDMDKVKATGELEFF